MLSLRRCRSCVFTSSKYKAWGLAQQAIAKAKGTDWNDSPFSNPIRFQGQYLDAETGFNTTVIAITIRAWGGSSRVALGEATYTIAYTLAFAKQRKKHLADLSR